MNRKILVIILGVCFIFVATYVSGRFFNNFENKGIERIEFPSIAGSKSQTFDIYTEITEIERESVATNVIEIKNSKLYDDKELLDIFNMADYKKNREGNYSVFENDNSRLVIYNTGQFLYYSKLNNIFDLDREVNLSDKECIKIAKDFLEENNLLRMDVYRVLVNSITKTDPADLDNEQIIGKDIYFHRSINDKEVYGVSRIIVTIAPNGEISEIRSLYRNTGNIVEARVKTIEKALEEVKQHNAMVETGLDVEKVYIDKVEVVYWEDSSPDSESKHIQPVYLFTGKGYNSDRQERKFVAVASMIDDEDTIPKTLEKGSRNTKIESNLKGTEREPYNFEEDISDN